MGPAGALINILSQLVVKVGLACVPFVAVLAGLMTQVVALIPGEGVDAVERAVLLLSALGALGHADEEHAERCKSHVLQTHQSFAFNLDSHECGGARVRTVAMNLTIRASSAAESPSKPAKVSSPSSAAGGAASATCRPENMLGGAATAACAGLPQRLG